MPTTPYIGATVPAKVLTTDGQTNLFRYAARELGDPLLAWQLAEINGMADFWPVAGLPLKVPQTAADDNDGLQPS